MATGVYVRTAEARRNIGLAQLGKKHLNRRNPKWTAEHRKKFIEAHSGEKHWAFGKKFSAEHIEKLRTSHLGHKHTEEQKEKMRKIMTGRKTPWNTGANNHTWKGGVTPIHAKIRRSGEYRRWRQSVITRDGFACVVCQIRDVRLDVDHIKSFIAHPELRFDIKNGRTLCRPCHMQTLSYGQVLANDNYMDKIFPDGIYFNLPSDKAPEWVKGKLTFKVDEAVKFLEANQNNAGLCNIDLLLSKTGKGYAALNQFEPKKPESLQQDDGAESSYDFTSDDESPNIPF